VGLAFSDFKPILITLTGLTEIEAVYDFDVADLPQDRDTAAELTTKPSVGFRPGLVFEEMVLLCFANGSAECVH